MGIRVGEGFHFDYCDESIGDLVVNQIYPEGVVDLQFFESVDPYRILSRRLELGNRLILRPYSICVALDELFLDGYRRDKLAAHFYLSASSDFSWRKKSLKRFHSPDALPSINGHLRA